MPSAEVCAEARMFDDRAETLTEVFGKTLASLATDFQELVVLGSGVGDETGCHHFRRENPDRFLAFGNAERAMMSAAGGLSAIGLLPVVTALAADCLRAVEQVRLALAWPKRNVKLVAARPGLDAGADGTAAQALDDIAQFRALPGMTVIAPADSTETALATRALIEFDGPVYMRAGLAPGRSFFGAEHRFIVGKGVTLRNGTDVTLIACGAEVADALEAADLLAADSVSVCVVNMATIKPLDRDLLATCSEVTGAVVTVENHSVIGGLGGAVAEALSSMKSCPLECIGVRDAFGMSGEPSELARHFGIGAAAIAEAAHRVLKRKSQRSFSRERAAFRPERRRLSAAPL